MALEPAVEHCIRKHQKQARIKKVKNAILIALPVGFGILVLLAFGGMDIIRFHLQEGAHAGRDYGVSMFLLIALAVMTFCVGLAYNTHAKMIRNQYNWLSHPVQRFPQGALQRWREALEAVSIRAGVEPPELQVLAIPTPNTVSFELKDSRRPAIGISEEALTAPLSYEEIEAIMAHELAHVLTRSYFPVPLLVTNIFWFVLGLVTVILAIVLLVVPSVYMIFLVLFLPLVPAVIFLTITEGRDPVHSNPQGSTNFWTGRSLPFTVDTFKGPKYEMDIVADSIAAKMISDPQALSRAIGKAKDLAEKSPMPPPQKIIYDHLFVGPFQAWEAEQSDESTLRSKSKKLAQGPTERESIGMYVESRHQLVSDRLTNLKDIEEGLWKVFEEARGGRVVTTAPGWE